MRQRRLTIAALLTFLIASCLWPSDAPELLDTPDGLSVEAFDSQTLEVTEQGRLEVVFNTPAIAVSAVSLQTNGAGGEATIEVAYLSGRPDSLPQPSGRDTYQFIEIAVGNLAEESIESITITFNVSRSWLD